MDEKLWDKSDFARALQGQKHTPEPWFAKRGDVLNSNRSWGIVVPLSAEECEAVDGDTEGYSPTADGRTEVIAEVCSCLDGVDEACAKRIVACVNACAGIPTTALEAGVVGELTTQLNDLVFRFEHMDSPEDSEAIESAIAVLAKLEATP